MFSQLTRFWSPILTWVSNCFTFLPGLFMVLVVVMISRYPINKKVFVRVMDALERRKQGEEIDVKEFEDIFE